jgi:hypothetical protein
MTINDRYALSRDKTPYPRPDGVYNANTFKSDRRWKLRSELTSMDALLGDVLDARARGLNALSTLGLMTNKTTCSSGISSGIQIVTRLSVGR